MSKGVFEGNFKNILIVAGAVVLVLIIIFLVLNSSPAKMTPNGGGSKVVGPPSQTKEDAPAVEVPTAASKVSSGVAKPDVVAPAGASTDSSLRGYTLVASGNEFSPNTVIVNQGDIIHLTIKATDKAYEFSQPDYGIMLRIPKGESRIAEFQATNEGKFMFYCPACGGPASGPKGYIISVPKK